MRGSAVSYPREALLRAVRSVAEELGKPLPEGMAFELERPRHEGQGDRSASAAMQLSKAFSMPPRTLAARIVGRLSEDGSGFFDKIEVAWIPWNRSRKRIVKRGGGFDKPPPLLGSMESAI